MSFGLVNVPVKLMTATSPKDVRFHQLHDADNGRIQQKRVCSLDGEEVEFGHILKGYDLGGGRMVVVDPEELAVAASAEASRTIDIEEFVELSEIDPIYFEKSYYLVPDARAEKAYALLTATMARTGKVAIGRFVLRTKQSLAVLRPRDEILVLSTMLYDDEVVEPADLEVPVATQAPSDRELKMAEQLVESLTVPFEPAKFHDDHREKVLALIEAKADGEIIERPEAEAERAPVVDLIAALEASLARSKQSA